MLFTKASGKGATAAAAIDPDSYIQDIHERPQRVLFFIRDTQFLIANAIGFGLLDSKTQGKDRTPTRLGLNRNDPVVQTHDLT